MKKTWWLHFLSIVFTIQSHATLSCRGWVGAHDESSGLALKIDKDTDNSTQTVVTGYGDGLHALLIFHKATNEVEVSVTDTKTGFTAGSHGSFNGQGLINIGFTLRPTKGQEARHVLFECRLKVPKEAAFYSVRTE